MTIYVFIAHSTASEITGYQDGNRHRILCYGEAETLEAAQAIVLAGLARNGWLAAEIIKSQPLGVNIEDIEKPSLRRAASAVHKTGCSFLIYPDVVIAES